MGKKLIKDSTLTGIANAIRAKGGTSGTMTPQEMPEKIAAIPTGGDIDALIDRSITEISSSSVTSIGVGAFFFCSELTTANFPAATSIGNGAFYYCISLTTVNFTVATSIGNGAFYSCSSLTTVDFPSASSIGNTAFKSCSNLKSLLLRGNMVCTLSSKNAFDSTPIASGTGYIYVPSALIEQYKAATNWSTLAAQFRALEEYTVDGTITGELDPSKVGV